MRGRMLELDEREWGLLALYMVVASRRDGLLELESRRRIFEHVLQYPGLHLTEIARGLDMDVNHARYHLDFLERHDLVSARREDGYVRYFARETGPHGPHETLSPREKTLLTMLRRPVPLHVTVLLLEREEATATELLVHLSVGHATLQYHLKRMERAGVLESRKAGRERFYRLPDRETILQLLLRYRPPDALVAGFLDAWEDLGL